MEARGKGLKLYAGFGSALPVILVIEERVPKELFELAEENVESANWLLTTRGKYEKKEINLRRKYLSILAQI